MDRLSRICENMSCDAAVIRSFTGRRYLTGFCSSAGTLVLTKQECYFIVDSRYIQSAREQLKSCTVLLESEPQQLSKLLQKHHVKTVGFETAVLSLEEVQELKEQVQPAHLLTDTKFQKLLIGMRQIKDAYELKCFQQAQEITDKAFLEILNDFKPGVSELDIMLHFGELTARMGCEKRSFNMIFTSGERTALPHGDPKIRTIQSGDFVMMDVGAMIGGYAADMTRTVAVGFATEEQQEVYKTVLCSQQAALKEIAPEKICCEIDQIARKVIKESPYGDGCFNHGLGHCVGLEIHEEPRFNPTCTEKLKPGMVITVEPGIYLPGKFGVRIEDMITITQTGYRNFTKSPKELLIL